MVMIATTYSYIIAYIIVHVSIMLQYSKWRVGLVDTTSAVDNHTQILKSTLSQSIY